MSRRGIHSWWGSYRVARLFGVRRPALAGALAFVTAGLSGCVLALGPQRHVSGAELPARLDHLQVGVSEERLLALYGLPTQRQSRSASHIELQWTEVIRPRACRTYFLFVIPVTRDPRMTRQVRARLEAGQLVAASVRYVDRRGTVTSTDSLLQSLPDRP